MDKRELNGKAKSVALTNGADLVGVVKASDLPEHDERISRILPSAQSVMVVAAKHSLAAIRSPNNQMAQFDTIHTYNACTRAAHHASRLLESEGFPSYGFRFFKGFMQDLVEKPTEETKELFRGHGLLEMWQTFMTGNYYYCFQCQSQCPATDLPQRDQ